MPKTSGNVQHSSAVAQLRWCYQNRHSAAREQHRAGKPVIGVTSNTVPRELIESSEMFPILLSPDPASDGPSAEFMESVFDARTRSIFDFLVSGEGRILKSVVIPRTSEPEHKLFLYLKEIQRQKAAESLPDICLYNLLHTRSEDARQYSWERTLELKDHLQELGGKEITTDSLRAAIRANNDARNAARLFVELRQGSPAKLSGTEAVMLMSARYFTGASDYKQLATEAVREIEQREPLQGPRILIKGYPLDHTCLHREIESHGAIVFAEDDWWGSRSATNDIALEGDPLEAIFDHYYWHEISPRVLPIEIADRWFRKMAQRADGVVFYLPPEDDVIGWDYPRHHKYLDEIGVPHLFVRIDARRLAKPESHPPRIWHAEDEEMLAIERTRETIADFIGKLM